jgi:FlaA1/EpsC-like NDP-sugar epimerase
VMGATKRLAELFVLSSHHGALSNGARPSASPTYAVARLCNVFGSRGSVVPTFERQIARGGPLSLCDPEASRYFISMADAAELILRSAAYTRGGDIFVPDVRTPIRIADLAESMIRGRGLRPLLDIPIVHTGMRPGEKLHDELVYDTEASQRALFRGALRVTPEVIPTRDRLDHYCAEISEATHGVASSQIANAIFATCAQLTPASMPLSTA